jgi:hypothetical protein
MHHEYEQTYHELLYKQWVDWHRDLEREADRSIRRVSRAASTFHRFWAIKWTRPRIRRRRARSEICVCTVDGFHHSDQTVSQLSYVIIGMFEVRSQCSFFFVPLFRRDAAITKLLR